MRGNGGINLVSCVLHALRVFVGQVVLGQDGVHLDVVVTLLAQHVDDLAHEVLRLFRWPLCDFYYCLLSALATLQFLLRNEYVLRKNVVFSNKEGKVLFNLENAYSLIVLTLQDFGDDGLLDVVLSAGHQCYPHPVASHSRHRVALGDEDGLAAIVGYERVLAVGLTDKGTLLHLRLQVQPITALLHLTDIVVPCHFFQHIDGEHLGRMSIQPQRLENLLQ